jgi:redox-sensitive bicupin YhaK (pirin superfamily)
VVSTVEANPEAGQAATPEAGPAAGSPAAGSPAAGSPAAGSPAAGPPGEPDLTTARVARVGDMEVRRLMPLRRRRSVGAWCFVDHYGPLSVDGVAGMQVPPHPHIGLQTVTWLLDGNVLHRDSLGSEQMIRPGQLNLMTSGRGIAHSEESPDEHDPRLHGVQLWVALPEQRRDAAPGFEHHAELPSGGLAGFEVTVMAGELGGLRSPATTFSPLVGAQLRAGRDTRATLVLDPGFEHMVFAVTGAVRAGGTELAPGRLLYLSTGRDRLDLAAPAGATALLLGGEPLTEPLLMWWNFVARRPEDIVAAARDWSAGGGDGTGSARFGPVRGYRGAPLAAPPLDTIRLTRPSRGG